MRGTFIFILMLKTSALEAECLSQLNNTLPAINADYLSYDITGDVGNQEGHCIGDILRCGWPFFRNTLNDSFKTAGRGTAGIKIGQSQTGSNAIYVNPGSRHLISQNPGESHNSGLGRSVNRCGRESLDDIYRGGVNYLAAI